MGGCIRYVLPSSWPAAPADGFREDEPAWKRLLDPGCHHAVEVPHCLMCTGGQGDEHINSAANMTAVRAARIADYLSKALPGTTVLILGLLPRGDVTLHPDPAALSLPSK